MANCKVSDIVRDVRVVMDLNSTDNQLVGVKDMATLEISEIISNNIETAAKDVLLSAPTRLLGEGCDMKDAVIRWQERKPLHVGRIELPSDFMRLITFKMEGWRNAVSEPIADDSPLYSLCHSTYSGVYGNPEQPVVAIVTGANGVQELEFYSCENNNINIERGRYIKEPHLSKVPSSSALPFDGIMNIENIEPSGFIGSRYSAIFDTNTKMFVFTDVRNAGIQGVVKYYQTCTDGKKYNDEINKTVQQNQLFICNKTLYTYDEITGGIKAIADSISEYIDIPVQLYDTVIYRTAYLTYLVLGDDNGAKRMADGVASEGTEE